jgi:hypothetical protein
MQRLVTDLGVSLPKFVLAFRKEAGERVSESLQQVVRGGWGAHQVLLSFP